MRVDAKVKFAANMCVNVVLLILYVYFFGHDSVSKYLDKAKAVITTSKDATSSSIIPPGD